MAEPKNEVVPAGELLLLHAGEYDGVYAAGLYRARVDLDFDALTKDFARTVPHDGTYEAPELPPTLMGNDPRSDGPMERGFIAWLIDSAMIERVPTASVRLDGDPGRKERHLPWVSANVDLATPEPEPGLRM